MDHLDGRKVGLTRQRLLVKGGVQGVGFRPSVVKLASTLGLSGFVQNLQHGVAIEIEGPPTKISQFLEQLQVLPPPIDVQHVSLEPLLVKGERDFVIASSQEVGGIAAYIPVDLAPCLDCLTELRDPKSRRFRFPFISCASCGPRYSILRSLPFDRSSTTMGDFPLCMACQCEYDTAGNRRYHAQTMSCPSCGPELTWRDQQGQRLTFGYLALTTAAMALRQGAVIGVKGVGGYQLLAMAQDVEAIAQLRRVKQRPHKPLVILSSGVEAITDLVELSEGAASQLLSQRRPIVLMTKSKSLAESKMGQLLAPTSRYLGMMLPSSAVHELLVELCGGALVVTSANAAGEPMAIEEREIFPRLATLADGWLTHNRVIINRCDDSIVMASPQCSRMVRLGRGFSPSTFRHNLPADSVLVALGGQQKNTIAVVHQDAMVVSQHIGDLANPLVVQALGEAVNHIERITGCEGEVVVADTHPDYNSSHIVKGYSRSLAVQHHLAHAWSCITEHSLVGPVLAIVWDGTGYGTDATVWGGEFLLIDGVKWQRCARLRPFPLPGGEQAVKEPRRSALGLLYESFGPQSAEFTAELKKLFAPDEQLWIRALLTEGINTPWCSSVGRLFDAIAAILGVCSVATYADHAPSLVEMEAASSIHARAYHCDLKRQAGGFIEIDWSPCIAAMMRDRDDLIPVCEIAAGFHESMARAAAAVVGAFDIHQVVMSGGVFNNEILASSMTRHIEDGGMQVFRHEKLPCGDGGLAVGQAAFALVAREGGPAACV